jgi:nicotinate-nucleotide pyrophosphorylase (carboxylating)
MADNSLLKESDIARFLSEDVGRGDMTTDALIAPDKRGKAEFHAKEDFILAGINDAIAIFRYLDPGLKAKKLNEDRSGIKRGVIFCEIEGGLRALLTAERTALNLLQRMCGIATLSAEYAAAAGGKTKILDTRKTAPGMRLLEKYAVQAGGCFNHRMGLDDGILIKDNHIRCGGGIAETVKKAREKTHHLLKIEIEVADLDELKQAIKAGVDAVLLDNMTDEMIKKAVETVGGKIPIEVSGGITLERIKTLSKLGVDYISVGALTHSARAVDISLEIVPI